MGDLYFDVLPNDVRALIFTYGNHYDISVYDQEIWKMPCFKFIYEYKLFWQIMWRRDISSIIEPPAIEEIKKIHFIVLGNYSSYDGHSRHDLIPQKLWNYECNLLQYLTKNGYDICILKCVSLFDSSHKAENFTASIAACYGHKKIIEDMMKLGASDYDHIFGNAAGGGYIDIMELMIQKGLVNRQEALNSALGNAAFHGQEQVVDLLINLGATDYYFALYGAVMEQRISVIKKLIRLPMIDRDRTLLYEAVKTHNPEIMKLLVNSPIKFDRGNYKFAYVYAKSEGSDDMVKLLEPYQ